MELNYKSLLARIEDVKQKVNQSVTNCVHETGDYIELLEEDLANLRDTIAKVNSYLSTQDLTVFIQKGLIWDLGCLEGFESLLSLLIKEAKQKD
jgi:hypothetical protein